MYKSNKAQSDAVTSEGPDSPLLVALREARVDQAEFLRLRIEKHMEAWVDLLTGEELALLRASLQAAVAADPHIDNLCAILAGKGDGSIT